MRKITIIFLSILFVVSGYAKTASITKARDLADPYFSSYSGKSSVILKNSFSVQYNGTTVYHVFNYEGGGFVVVSASDAVSPILAQSDEGFIAENITNPAVKYWFDSYAKEIESIITSNADNTETLKEWINLSSKTREKSVFDAGPLLTTEWSQEEWYNYYCPVDPKGSGGHAAAGCVANAMAQIMKYHNFPVQGNLSYSYKHPIYGTQTANFGETVYKWESMGYSASSTDYQSIATLIYHAGVSVNMYYGTDASWAYTLDVPDALVNYFNYDPVTISIAEKVNYTDSDWKELLKAELHASRPVFYVGYSLYGHAWVCDGWRNSDDMFHMNWGWTGKFNFNGWYQIGALNTAMGHFNEKNVVVKGIKPIKPSNLNLIARITNLVPNQLIAFNSILPIDCSVVKGVPNKVNLYVDDVKVHTDTKLKFTYNLATLGFTLGNHTIKIEALNSTDTTFYEVKVRNSEWISSMSGFEKPMRGISYLHVIDSLNIWATAFDADNASNIIQEFTRTDDGGLTWISGNIDNCTGLAPSMVFALCSDTAFCPMYKQSGINPQGIYVTTDGGTHWTRQTTASFSEPTSFPNVVHFFDKQNGLCIGNPINGEFEIYTTNNLGTKWVKVSVDSIPNPLPYEKGIIGSYSAIGNNIWFGTTKGRIYRSNDRGHHWAVSSQSWMASYEKSVQVVFADQLHGLAIDISADSKGVLAETFDGGITWSGIDHTGKVGTSDLCFVPGTENTWVSSGVSDSNGQRKGVYYSIDGGYNWTSFAENESDMMLKVKFTNRTCGWIGGINASAGKGMFKFVSKMKSETVSLLGVTNLKTTLNGSAAKIEWNAPPSGNVTGYNVYRNNILLNAYPFQGLSYNDYPYIPLTGKHTYCVVSVYPKGESEPVCTDVWITTGIPENKTNINVYPNPATEIIKIETSGSIKKVIIYNLLGQEVYNNAEVGNILSISTSGFKPGAYVLQIDTGKTTDKRKIIIY